MTVTDDYLPPHTASRQVSITISPADSPPPPPLPNVVLGQGGDDDLAGGRGHDDCRGGVGTDSAVTCEVLSRIP